MTCERCGHALQLGDYPFCKGDPTGHAAGLLRVKPDTIVGGFLAENAWREPRFFDSQKQYERALSDSGLMLKQRRVSGDRSIDPQTLENARRLVARTKSVAITERVLDETVTVEATV